MPRCSAFDTFQSPARVKSAARMLILCAAILAFGVTTLFAQVVGVEVRQPVGIPAPSNSTTGPDPDKKLVEQRWEAIFQAASQHADKDKSKSTEAKKAPDGPQ